MKGLKKLSRIRKKLCQLIGCINEYILIKLDLYFKKEKKIKIRRG